MQDCSIIILKIILEYYYHFTFFWSSSFNPQLSCGWIGQAWLQPHVPEESITKLRHFVTLNLNSLSFCCTYLTICCNVVKTLTAPIFDGLYRPFIVKLGMVYDCFNNTTHQVQQELSHHWDHRMGVWDFLPCNPTNPPCEPLLVG